MEPTGPALHFINVQYFFHLIYDLVFGAHVPSLTGLQLLASNLWVAFTIFAYIFTLICIGVLIYYSLRLYQMHDELDKRYGTITESEEHAKVEHSRWAYIRQLIEGTQESNWRQAIIESDIMLDEMLTKQGFIGDSVGEKLKSANPSHFHTIRDAWDAHMVRNQIAHEGSAYELTEHVAHQTINKYQNVFAEFHEI